MKRTVEDWQRVVFQSRTISDKVRVLLLYFAEAMNADRKVSIPQDRVATALGISDRRVGERVRLAHQAGFLTTVSRGQKGHTAVYQGLFPSVQPDTRSHPETAFSRTATSTLMPDSMSHPEKPFSRTYGGPTSTTADPSPGGHHRHVSNDGEVGA